MRRCRAHATLGGSKFHDRVARSRAAVAARTVVADARSLVSYKTMPASTEPLLGDDELDRVAQCMSPASHACGYYELDLSFDYDIGRCSVWLPVPKPIAKTLPRVENYQYTVHWAKKMTALTQGWVCMPCLPSFNVKLPAGPEVVAIDPQSPPPNIGQPVAAVLMAHGLSGPRFEFCHVAEALACRGFIVMVPEMEDSGCNRRRTVMEYGANGLGKHTVLRMHQLHCCSLHLKSLYGEKLKFGLLGYSIGNAAVRHFRCDWPKCHIAGPSPVGKTAPVAPFVDETAQESEASTTNAPCLLLLSHADSLSPPPQEASALAGHDKPIPLTIEHLLKSAWPKRGAVIHSFNSLPHPSFTHPEIVERDQSIMKKCSCLLACPDGEEVKQSRRAARLLVPLIVRFFEQSLGSGGLPKLW